MYYWSSSIIIMIKLLIHIMIDPIQYIDLVREIKASPWKFWETPWIFTSLPGGEEFQPRFKSCGPGSVHVQITGRWDRSVAGQRMGISHGITEVCSICLWMFKWWYWRWSSYSTVVRLKSKQHSWHHPALVFETDVFKAGFPSVLT